MPPLILAPLSGAPPPPPPGLSVFPPPFSPPISRTLDRYSRRCTKSLASWPVGEKNSCYGSHLVASYPGDRQADPCVRHLTLLHADSVSLRRLALEQVRHVGDDRVLAEEKCPLDEKGRLVVQEVLPPSPREEFRQNDRDHLLVASRLDLVDVVEKRPQERPVRRRQDDQRNAEPPLAPLLLHLGLRAGSVSTKTPRTVAVGASVFAYCTARATPRWTSPTRTSTVCWNSGGPSKPSSESSLATSS